MNPQVLVLAAGRSTRFGDPVTKLLHEVGRVKALRRVLDNLRDARFLDIHLVVGHQKELIFSEFPDCPAFTQLEQLGTGHAVAQAKGLNNSDCTFVVFGDKPLFKPQTLREFIKRHYSVGAPMTIATISHPSPDSYSEGYGTVVRVEGKLMALRKVEGTIECDGGLYAFKTEWLWSNIHRLQPHDNGRGKKEYFLPDLVEIVVGDGETVGEYRVENYKEAIGINTQKQLQEAEAYLKE